jgi:hypothetical protein
MRGIFVLINQLVRLYIARQGFEKRFLPGSAVENLVNLEPFLMF